MTAFLAVTSLILFACGGNVPESKTYTVRFCDISDHLIGVKIEGSDALVYEQKVKEGESAVAPTAPAIDGYTFERWDVDYTNVKSDLTVKPVYKAVEPQPTDKTYTVKFYDYDHTVIGVRIGESEELVYEQNVKSGESAVAPISPYRDGYRFKGWNKEFASVTTNLEITAQYVQVCEVVFWNDNEIHEVYVVDYGKDAELPSTDPIKLGYRFDHWDGNYQNVIADTDVDAVFVKQYNVTFLGYEGVEIEVQTVDEHADAIAPIPPQVEGRVFDYWDKSFTDVTSDITVNAVYREASSFNVTFIDHDGAVLKEERVYQNTGATAPDMTGRDAYVDFDLTEKQGYGFSGWDKDFSSVTDDMTVQAQYTQINVPILYVKPEVVTKGSGNYVTVSIYVVSNTPFSGLNINIAYDDALYLSEDNVSVKSIFNIQDRYALDVEEADGVLNFSWLYSSGECTLTDNYSKVLELKFEIDDYISVGEYAVEILSSSYYVKNYLTDTPVIISGCVSVEEA